MSGWVKADRIDSRLARGLGVVMTPSAVDKIHRVAVRRSQHECDVLCGGMRTEASRYYAGHAPSGVCADCDWGCVPG
eukprot:4226564-Alexandrium_andersonii.AAC.1